MDLPLQGRFDVKGQEAQKIGQKDARHIRPPSAYSILQNHFEEVLQRFCQTAEGFGATSELHGRNMRHEERQIDKVWMPEEARAQLANIRPQFNKLDVLFVASPKEESPEPSS